ncbi:immediate-early transactivator protein with Zn finger (cell nucleus) [Bovine herpesvirus type 1.1 (strain Cooper)]|uniref:E3 ubiquitin-protein ligase ICP0 n=1 Tax=Bovine herpesvirus 1.1 (strain Cooper) TaxID=10323 RepID=ICP0_BHV1C|nr:RecName: Full=E3 ubiquitin-protein ligase ICP0; AltName: Full=IER 2.9/ER2.6; AltName: Full=P135 protein; AltName: Full=RING-type E3 ubiquitin transferase ICP0 [Bovine herpesvirus type 1.1 (strain Jura)]AAA46062.1 p135 protein [Bovine alphaherpesvirus 1]CAA06138.1 immediate-early transactivator protein with Zn finger (cell nucleus) [Bovine herpesvirus type 1.1]
MAPPAAAPELGSCCICLDAITGAARALPCLHAFCLACIRRWLEGRPTCPLCKAPVQSLIHSVASDECFEEIPVGGGPGADGALEPDAAVIWGEDYDAGPIDLTAADGEASGAGGEAGAADGSEAGGGAGGAEEAGEARGAGAGRAAGAAGGRAGRGADAAQEFIDRVARGPRLPLLPNTPEHGPGAPYLRRVVEWVEGALVGSFAVTARELAAMTDYVMAMLAECGFDDDGLADAMEPLIGEDDAPAFVRSLLFVAARCVTVGPSHLIPQQSAPPGGRGVVFLDTSDSDSEGSEDDSWSESEESSSGLSTSDLTAIDDTETEPETDAEVESRRTRGASGAARARRPAERQYVSTRGRQTPAVQPAPRSLARRPCGRAAAVSAPPSSRSRGGRRDPRLPAAPRAAPAAQARACSPEPREEGRGAGLGVAAGETAGWGAGSEEGRGERRARLLGEAGPPRVQARRRRRTELDRAPTPAPAPAPAPAPISTVIDLTANAPARPADPAPAAAPGPASAGAQIGTPAAAAAVTAAAAAPSVARSSAPSPAVTAAATSTAAAISTRAPTPSPAGRAPAADPRRAGAPALAGAARAEVGRNGNPGRERRPASAMARGDLDPGPESSAQKRRRTEMEVAAWVRESLLGTPRRSSAALAPQPGGRQGPSLAGLLGRCSGGSAWRQ